MATKRILRFQSQKIAAFAQHDVRVEGQLAKQRGAEFCPGYRFTNDEGARSTHVHDIMGAQLLGQDAGAKGSVSANIDAPEEDDKGHTPDYEEKS